MIYGGEQCGCGCRVILSYDDDFDGYAYEGPLSARPADRPVYPHVLEEASQLLAAATDLRITIGGSSDETRTIFVSPERYELLEVLAELDGYGPGALGVDGTGPNRMNRWFSNTVGLPTRFRIAAIRDDFAALDEDLARRLDAAEARAELEAEREVER